MPDDRDLLDALKPTLHELLDRHLAASREWFPHELVPWERAADRSPRAAWDPAAFPLDEGVRSALWLNLLTEDNLPHYFETINRVFYDEAWRVWARRWTAEEMRHSIVLRDYLTVTCALDPVALERARMAQVSGAQVPQPSTVPDALVYVALQELATRVAHWNAGERIGDPAGRAVMRRVAADENLHHLFYRDLVAAALAVDPATVLLAIDRQVRTFEMPGTGIPDFDVHARRVARAGIYDLALYHDAVLVPVLVRHWRLPELEGLTGEAEAARERVLAHLARLGNAARHLAERRARQTSPASV
ncbi:MAG: acyl-ACP desaturase [Acidimicrobiia bacterium]